MELSLSLSLSLSVCVWGGGKDNGNEHKHRHDQLMKIIESFTFRLLHFVSFLFDYNFVSFRFV